MKAQELRDIAGRLLRLADELDGISTERGAIKVTLPQPDLFSQMGLTTDNTLDQVEDLCNVKSDTSAPVEAAPAKRIYQRVGCRMQDEAVKAAQKVGRAQGYCQRSDIERSLRRENPVRSREEIREAVNKAVAQLGLTCIVYNSYRYYRRSDRKRILEAAMQNYTPRGETI